jgi:hypothetical protein
MKDSKKNQKIGQLQLPLMQSDIQKTMPNGVEMGKRLTYKRLTEG